MVMMVAMPVIVPMVMVVIMGMTVVPVSQALQRACRFRLAVEQGFQGRPHHLVARR